MIEKPSDTEESHLRTSSEQLTWGFELLNKVSLKGNERVLDLGCGDGTITAEIARRVPKGSVLGIDKSEGRIRLAREHFPPGPFPNLVFEIGDIRNLALNGEFDMVFSNAVLHWIRDQVPLLRRIRQGLKQGGAMFAQMGGKGNAAGILEAVERTMNLKRWRPYFTDFSVPYTFWDVADYEESLRVAGFRVIRIEAVPRMMLHAGKDGLTSWVGTTWLYYTGRVPKESRSTFIETVAEEYIAQQGLSDNDTIPVAMVRIEFEAMNAP